MEGAGLRFCGLSVLSFFSEPLDLAFQMLPLFAHGLATALCVYVVVRGVGVADTAETLARQMDKG